jgi:hypothetical protein
MFPLLLTHENVAFAVSDEPLKAIEILYKSTLYQLLLLHQVRLYLFKVTRQHQWQYIHLLDR